MSYRRASFASGKSSGMELHKLLFESMGRVLRDRTPFELFTVFAVKPCPSCFNGAILKNAVVFSGKLPTGQSLQHAQTRSVKLSRRQQLRWKEGQRLRYSKSFVKAWLAHVIQEKLSHSLPWPLRDSRHNATILLRKPTSRASVFHHASFASMKSLACTVVQTALYTGADRKKLTGNFRSCWCTLFERESHWKFSTFLPQSVCVCFPMLPSPVAV